MTFDALSANEYDKCYSDYTKMSNYTAHDKVCSWTHSFEEWQWPWRYGSLMHLDIIELSRYTFKHLHSYQNCGRIDLHARYLDDSLAKSQFKIDFESIWN